MINGDMWRDIWLYGIEAISFPKHKRRVRATLQARMRRWKRILWKIRAGRYLRKRVWM